MEGCGDGCEFAAEAFAQDLAARGLGLVFECGGAAGEAGPEGGEGDFAGRVVQDGAGVVHEVVSGGAVGGPIGREAFMGEQDLLDPEHGPLAQAVRALRGEGVEAAAELAAVVARAGEAIDVVDADAIDEALLIQAEDRAVGVLEHFRHLDADAGEAVHVEEAAPVDLVGGGAPPGQAIGLAFEQAVEALLALGRGRVVGAEGLGDGGGVGGLQQLLAGGLGRAADFGAAAGGEFVEEAGRGFERAPGGEQDGGVVARVHREAMVVVVDDETPSVSSWRSLRSPAARLSP